MKSSLVFRDQVAAMGSWFELWNPCEQTVGLYSLLRRLGPTQARFLALVLDRSLADCTELRQRERHANDPAYIERLAREPREQALGQLLGLLPLLAPGNQAAKQAYLALIPQVLAHALDCRPLVEGARQLLSYSLIHPAISSRDDRRLLTLWLRHLEERISTSRYQEHGGGGPDALNGTALDDGGLAGGRAPGSGLDSWPAVDGLGSLNGHHHHQQVQQQQQQQQHHHHHHHHHHFGGDLNGLAPLGGGSLPPGLDSSHMALHPSNLSSTFAPAGQSLSQPMLKRSSSLTPPCSVSSLHQQLPQGFGNGGGGGRPMLGGSSPHPTTSVDWRCVPPAGLPPPPAQHEADALGPPLSPQSSGASSGSEGHGAEDQLQPGFGLDGSGMKDVPSWLKSLRLHKYAYLFANMSYEEMMGLTEDKLEAQSVTKGARHKIVLSIRKLKERPTTLRQLEKSLQEEGDVRTALVELRAMLQTPMKASGRTEDGNRDGSPHRGVLPSATVSSSSLSAHPSTSSGVNDEAAPSSSSSVVAEERGEGGGGGRGEEEESPPSSLDSAGCSPSKSGGGGAALTAGPGDVAGGEEDEDLPGLFARVVGKVCSSLLVSVRGAEDPSVGQFVTLVDKCLAHEAFSPAQKRRLFSWRQQVHKAWHPVPPRRCLDTSGSRHHHHHLHHPQQQHPLQPIGGGAGGCVASSPSSSSSSQAGGGGPPRPPPAGRWCGAGVLPPLVGGSDFGRLAGPNGPPTAAPLGRPPAVFFGGGGGASVDCPGGSSPLGGGGGGPLAMVIKRPSLQEHLNKPHVQIQRTHSAPVRPNPVVASLYKQVAAGNGRMQADASANDPEINNRLESLCLSVTEHALGGSDGMPPF